MFTKDTPPSPAVWLKRGGTSLWEDWGNGASRNHIMFGEFVCWAYQYLAGIRLADGAEANGFRKVVIDPQPIRDLAWARASVKLPQGVLASGWERVGDQVVLTVDVPAGTEAEVRLDWRSERVLGPQTRRFSCVK